MKLKVLSESETPKNCDRRVVLEHDDSPQEWVRDANDHVFLLWSSSKNHRGDRVFDTTLKTMVDVDSPFERKSDDEGWHWAERDGLIVIPVDVYDHSGLVWFLRGEAPAGCRCQFDSTCFNDTAPFFLYVDQARWEKYCGNCPWKFEDGKLSDELKQKAYEVARSEIRDMNLCESGDYYGYRTEEREDAEVIEVTIRSKKSNVTKKESREEYVWNEIDSCWGFLTDKPEKDVDFTLGCPVVSENEYLVGNVFEQECWAFSDDMTGKFVKFTNGGDSCELVDDPIQASILSKSHLESNLKHYENLFNKALTVVDVTERVWSRFPECLA